MTYDAWKTASPYEGERETPDAPHESTLRCVGYIGKRGRATVFAVDGVYTVVVDLKQTYDFEHFEDAEVFALNRSLGSQHRMGV